MNHKKFRRIVLDCRPHDFGRVTMTLNHSNAFCHCQRKMSKESTFIEIKLDMIIFFLSTVMRVIYYLSIWFQPWIKRGSRKHCVFVLVYSKKKDGQEGTEIKSLGKLEGDIEHFAKQRAFLPKLGLNHMVSLERTDFCCFTMKQQVLF